MPAEQATYEELHHIAQRLAQDLQEYVDAGVKAGSDMTATRQLLEEWEVVHRRTPFHWLNQVDADEEQTTIIDQL